MVLLCVSCHELAQKATEQLKRKISKECDIPLFPYLARNVEQEVEGKKFKVGDNDGGDGSDAPSERDPGSVSNPSTSHLSTSASAAAAGAPPHLQNPFNVRKAAIALHRNSGILPSWRKEELQLQISSYVRVVEPSLQHLPPDAPFSDVELWAGLLGGMSRASRRRSIRKWIAKGATVPEELLMELDTTIGPIVNNNDNNRASEQLGGGGDAEGDDEESHRNGIMNGGATNSSSSSTINNVVDVRDALGHTWHGQKVVEKLLNEGGDAALDNLCARFRKAFVDAVRPQYLPPGWRVDHKAPRGFGEHSSFGGDEQHSERRHQKDEEHVVEKGEIEAVVSVNEDGSIELELLDVKSLIYGALL